MQTEYLNPRKIRTSNLELLRIIAMFMIMFLHYSNRSGGTSSQNTFNYVFSVFVGTGGRTAVNIFVIIGSWFLIDGKFKVDRIIRIWIEVFTYVIILTIISLNYFNPFNNGMFLELAYCLPLSSAPLWFPAYYIGLLIISPFLNLAIINMSKNIYKSLICVLLFWETVLPTFLPFFHRFYNELIWLICLYLIVGYLKRFPINFFNSKKNCIITTSIIYVMLFVYYLAFPLINNKLPILSSMGLSSDYYRGHMECIPALLMSLSIFYIFKNIEIRNNKTINTVASSTFAAYIIHETPKFCDILWNDILKAEQFVDNIYFPAYSIIVVILVFISCVIIDKLRLKIMNPILFNRTWYKNLCSHIDALVAVKEL